MRTEIQNKRLWSLLTRHNLHGDDESRAKLVKHFSEGRTTHTRELSTDECQALINHLTDTLAEKERTLTRLRWRLWFVFAESKYTEFRLPGYDKPKPNFSGISTYCKTHWGKLIPDMSERELEKYIAIVKHWK